ncbi:MAG: isoprenyl transferase [Bacteroidales bacterium]|jgi:undecaprenyl diphosphate synthase|nr:isoprenyl transferase [Bacteroidales bacterium]
MISLEDIKLNAVPRHIAIIMDGNGRWAKQRQQQRIEGHIQGAAALKSTLEGCLAVGVKYLTVYAFSLENWDRSPQEVNSLMNLFVNYCHTEVDNLNKNNIRFKAIGKLDMLNDECYRVLKITEEKTKDNTALTLVVAISYGSRWEIVHAAQQLAKEIACHKIQSEQINEQLFAKYLITDFMPDPDLLIRTSGEYRISNYLLWQIAYTELYFTNVLWPDFTKEELYEAIADYQKRERRFGKTSEQINHKLK